MFAAERGEDNWEIFWEGTNRTASACDVRDRKEGEGGTEHAGSRRNEQFTKHESIRVRCERAKLKQQTPPAKEDSTSESTGTETIFVQHDENEQSRIDSLLSGKERSANKTLPVSITLSCVATI
ncbi:hypothetical protein BLNAU_4824 [Blattamonas nauphoetae]|uniref:Uncharacterized protein n=1 Tax=Blattamonas nauphoetae TaxID=2049346 RepID=A0ABQ9Y943_9EUKA|nr:hypothetical protein BLNAU_4824 [Blattamonas nauphoetae]